MNQPEKPFEIFMADDNPSDVLLVREALKFIELPANLHVLEDGEQAVRFIDLADRDHSIPCPQLFLLDMNLPGLTGEEVLLHLRHSSRCADTPVVIFSSSESAAHIARTRQLGARRYVRKPCNYDQFMAIGGVMKEVLHEGERH